MRLPDFIKYLRTRGGLTKKEAESVFNLYKKEKIIKFKTGSGWHVTHGAFFDRPVIKRALKKTKRKNPCRNPDYKYYSQWEDKDGKIVIIDGYKHRLKVSVYTAKYPYIHKVITVDAVPINKTTKYYKKWKRKLGDDWSIGVLENFETEALVWDQVK